MHFDAALVRKYDQFGPRYTSYPTALQFSTHFDARCGADTLSVSNRADAPPISLYIHVPFCESPCFYCGCNKVITRDRERAWVYLAHLYLEIQAQAALLSKDRIVTQLHLGGGTPTYLSDTQLADLMRVLRQNFNMRTDGRQEYSIEIDPRTVSADRLSVLASLGFNRISLGVQDLDLAVQSAINRVQPPETTFNLIDRARSLAIHSVSIDLIYGLPLQTLCSFSQTLDRIIEARPDRIAAYSYAHLPHAFKAQRQIRLEDLPTPEVKLALLEMTVEKLTAAGYVYVGMDHFALPHDELVQAQLNSTLQRNFQGYSTHAHCDLIGLGVSAISGFDRAYSQNHKSVGAYQRSVALGGFATERGVYLTDDDCVRRTVIQAIMCASRVNYSEIESRHKVRFVDYFQRELKQLEPLAYDGLVVLSPQALEVTGTGRLLLRSVAMIFDAYMHIKSTETAQPRFSRTV